MKHIIARILLIFMLTSIYISVFWFYPIIECKKDWWKVVLGLHIVVLICVSIALSITWCIVNWDK